MQIARNFLKCFELAEDLIRVEKWESIWQMSMNPDKCEVLPREEHKVNYTYELDNSVLTNANVCRDLGVYFSKTLSFSHHCNIISRNVHSRKRQFQQSFACKN